MEMNAGNTREEFSADWVTARLKAVSSIEPPGSLRDLLEADVPATAIGEPAVRRLWKARWAGAAAAAAVVILSIAAWRGLPWEGQAGVVLDANSRAGRAYATDHNSLRPSDINLCDINGLR